MNQPRHEFDHWNGALLIHKPAGITSFGVIETLQRSLIERFGVKRRDLPKLGHGGTLDPFATGLLIVCAGRAVKLARYFLGSDKYYSGVIRLGETTVPGDPTAPISERSEHLPGSLDELQAMARKLQAQSYLQMPPMHSAKKQGGKPLYELARQGIEVEREPKLCQLREFRVESWEAPRARFALHCSSGTYVRVLAQDFGRLLGTVGMLDELRRDQSGPFKLKDACTLEQLKASLAEGRGWDELPCWVDFNRLLDGYESAEATGDEATALLQGRQGVLLNILKRGGRSLAAQEQADDTVVIYSSGKLVAVARKDATGWGLERVFT
jgi:tRNA pseudouridine55 synthase